MSASCYKIVPNRHVFLDFMITLDLSPEQRHCVETFPIRYVEVDEARNTWKIFYDAAATALEQQELFCCPGGFRECPRRPGGGALSGG